MTACVTSSPRYDSAVSFILPRMKAEIWLGLYFSPLASTQASPLPPSMTLNGMFFLSLARSASSARRPIRRLTPKIVFSGLVTAWRFAGWPTRRSSSVKATIEGVVRAPSEFSITRAWLPSMIATQELVVPRSIPMTLDMFFDPFYLKAIVRTPDPFRHQAPGFEAEGIARTALRGVYRQGSRSLQALGLPRFRNFRVNRGHICRESVTVMAMDVLNIRGFRIYKGFLSPEPQA